MAAIVRGNIPPDKPLPPSRVLASQLGVARNTVTLAYYRLKDDGFLVSKERSGFYVNPDAIEASAAVPRRATDTVDPLFAPDWSARTLRLPSAQRNIEKPGNWTEYPYPFIYGQLDYNLFPVHHWRECCRDAASVSAVRDWAGDQVHQDDDMLIAQIRQHLLPRRGVFAESDQIMITVGAQQALYMIARLFLDATTTIGIEDPGYVDIRNIADLNRARIQPLPIDEQGLVINNAIGRCDYVYVTPSHQSPTTVTLPLERRNALLDMAVRDDIVIIEDDYESEMAFLSTPTPALKSLDKNSRVIYVGSLSKTLAPGLRIGYVVASADLIRELRAMRRLIVRHPAANNQRAAAMFMARGYYESHKRSLVRTYKERHLALRDALDRYLPDSTTVPAHGGSSFWITAHPRLDARKLAEAAASHGLLIEPGDVHFQSANPPRNCFRLGFSSIDTERIEPGIKLLSELVERTSDSH